jgi:hypothetical protein
MSTTTDHIVDDVQIWILTRSQYCSAPQCSQPADIIAASPRHEQFCAGHIDQAATAAAQPDFAGWFRIEHTHYVGADLITTVHPL